MTGSPTRALHVRQKPCTHGLADADIVSAFPLSFYTFQENINTLRQTSRHDIPFVVGVLRLGSLRETSSPNAGYGEAILLKLPTPIRCVEP